MDWNVMTFSDAQLRYLELKLMLENRQIDQDEFDRQAANLRVLGPDNAWWQLRASDGLWFRWDGQAWSQLDPPESSFDRPTELAFEVKKSAPDGQSQQGQPDENVKESSEPPQAAALVSSQQKIISKKTVKILRGKLALDLLVKHSLIREIYTADGKRFQMIHTHLEDPIEGIAFRLLSDGYLDPDVAIQICETLSEETPSNETPAQGTEPLDMPGERQFGQRPGHSHRRSQEAELSLSPTPGQMPLSPRFQSAILNFLKSLTTSRPNYLDEHTVRGIIANLGGVFERDIRQLEIPALGPLSGEALTWFDTLVHTQKNQSDSFEKQLFEPIAQRFTLLADQPPLYRVTSRYADAFTSVQLGRTFENGLPFSAVFPIILTSAARLEDLYVTTYPAQRQEEGKEKIDNEQADDAMVKLFQNAALSRLKTNIEISKGLFENSQGRLIGIAGQRQNLILQEIYENALKTIEQLTYTGNPFLLSLAHLHLAVSQYDLAPEAAAIATFLQHIEKSLTICESAANDRLSPVLWLNIQIIPWTLVLLANLQPLADHDLKNKIKDRILSATKILDQTYEFQRQLRERASQGLFNGRAVLAILQHYNNTPDLAAIKKQGALDLEHAFSEFIRAGDLHLAGECRLLSSALQEFT